MGAVSGFGIGVEALAGGLRSGSSSIRAIRAFDPAPYRVGVMAEAPPSAELPDAPSRCDALAVSAAREAFRSAGLDRDQVPEGRTAVLIGTSAGDAAAVERVRRAEILGDGTPDFRDLRRCTLSSPGDAVALDLGLSGPRMATSTACSSGSVSICIAADLIRSGRAELALAGGVEAVSEFVFGGFHALMALDPELCRPFDARRQGLVLGEGAAVVVLESEAHALRRGRTPLALLSGYGLCCDSHHITAPEPTGREAARTMTLALADAGIPAGRIDHVDAHGTATLAGDVAEIRGLNMVFANRGERPTVSGMKGALGHTLGAAGGLSIVACVLQIGEGVVYPTANLKEIDPECAAHHVLGRAQPARIRTVLSNSFSFGGNNISVILEAPGHE